MRALGTIIEWSSEQPFEETEFYSGLLDYLIGGLKPIQNLVSTTTLIRRPHLLLGTIS